MNELVVFDEEGTIESLFEITVIPLSMLHGVLVIPPWASPCTVPVFNPHSNFISLKFNLSLSFKANILES